MACLSLIRQGRELAGLADAAPIVEVGGRLALDIHEQVEVRVRLVEAVPPARLQIGERQHAAKTNARAVEHAFPAQRLGGRGELAPDLVVHDWPEDDMPPPAAIKCLATAITGVVRIGAAHATTPTNARWSCVSVGALAGEKPLLLNMPWKRLVGAHSGKKFCDINERLN